MDRFALYYLGLLCIFSTLIPPRTSLSPALILSPYIEQNRTQEARNLSKVDPSLFLNVTSHSGFLTVDKRFNSNTFFWYFPVEVRPVNVTPWIVWLQGGPGASSLAGLFDEIGPFRYDAGAGRLQMRETSWYKEFSMLFIDNPIGAGYSFTDNEAGYAHNMTEYTKHLHSAVKQFLSIFPELKTAPLYIAGESYAGKYVPALAVDIMNETWVNLQGIILGSPTTDRSIENFTALFYNWGLVDDQGVLAANTMQDQFTEAVKVGDSAKAFEIKNKLLDQLQSMSGQAQTYNVLADEYNDLSSFSSFLAKEEITEAIHVGVSHFSFENETVYNKLVPDYLTSNSHMIETLLEKYRVLVYCGQLDLTIPCLNGFATHLDWQWSKKVDHLRAPRTPWWNNVTLAGYSKSGGGLTEVLVRGAGHLVPKDKPKEAQRLVSFFIRGIDLPLPPNYKVLPQYTPMLPKTQEDQSKEIHLNNEINDKSFIESSFGVALSIILNVILVLIIIGGVIFYMKMKRKYEAFYYSTIDNLSDDIFLN